MPILADPYHRGVNWMLPDNLSQPFALLLRVVRVAIDEMRRLQMPHLFDKPLLEVLSEARRVIRAEPYVLIKVKHRHPRPINIVRRCELPEHFDLTCPRRKNNIRAPLSLYRVSYSLGCITRRRRRQFAGCPEYELLHKST